MLQGRLSLAYLLVAVLFCPWPTRADPAPAPAAPAAAAAHPDLPESLKAISRTKKARFASAWGGYQLRVGGPVLAVSADGKHAASAGPDSPLRLWDLETGRQVRILGLAPEGATSAAFSPDGKQLACGGHDGSITVFSVETGKLSRVFRRHQGEVSALCFSPDGKRLASGGEDATVRVWNLGQGRGLYLAGHADFVRSVAFFTDGNRVASASDDGTVRVWDLTRGRAVKVVGVSDGPEAVAVAVSPDGTRLLVGREGIGVRVVDVESGEERALGEAPRVLAVACSPDGERGLAVVSSALPVRPAASRDAGLAQIEIRSWVLATGEALPPWVDADEGLVAAAFSADGKRALTSGGGLTVWDVEKGTALRHTVGHTGRIEAVVVSRDGKLALSAADDGTARLWDAFSGKELRIFPDYSKVVRTLAFSPDGTRALVGDAVGLVQIWEVDRLEPAGAIGPHRGILAAAFADDKTVVSASLERTAVWELATGKEVFSNWFPRIVNAVALSADGSLALAADLVDGPLMRETATGRVLKPLRRPERVVRSLALTRDGAVAALLTSPAQGSGPDALEIWDTAQGKLLRLARAPTGLKLLSFSEDGRLLLGASPDASVHLFAVKTLRETDRLDLQANAEMPTAAAFAPDGLSFLVGTSVGALQHYLIVSDPYR